MLIAYYIIQGIKHYTKMKISEAQRQLFRQVVVIVMAFLL